MKPNTLILRIKDIGGSKSFVSLPLDAEGYIVAKDACEFNVFDGDTYNQLTFDQLVFAVSSDGGESSIELARITVQSKTGTDPIVCHENPQQVALMTKMVFDDWENTMASATEQ